MRVFFGKLVRGLAQLAKLATIIVIISKDVGSFLELRVFLILKISFYQSVAMETTNITFSDYKNELTGHLSFSINPSLNNLLPIIKIWIFFVDIRSY